MSLTVPPIPGPLMTTPDAKSNGVLTAPWLSWFYRLTTALNSGPGPYDIGCWWAGKPAVSEKLLDHVFARTVTFPNGLTGSEAIAQTAATSSAQFTLGRNGAVFGNITFAAGATVGTFNATTVPMFNAGDIINIVGPGVQDTTLADISVTISGTRGS